jgi:hypothetical protein
MGRAMPVRATLNESNRLAFSGWKDVLKPPMKCQIYLPRLSKQCSNSLLAHTLLPEGCDVIAFLFEK